MKRGGDRAASAHEPAQRAASGRPASEPGMHPCPLAQDLRQVTPARRIASHPQDRATNSRHRLKRGSHGQTNNIQFCPQNAHLDARNIVSMSIILQSRRAVAVRRTRNPHVVICSEFWRFPKSDARSSAPWSGHRKKARSFGVRRDDRCGRPGPSTRSFVDMPKPPQLRAKDPHERYEN